MNSKNKTASNTGAAEGVGNALRSTLHKFGGGATHSAPSI